LGTRTYQIGLRVYLFGWKRGKRKMEGKCLFGSKSRGRKTVWGPILFLWAHKNFSPKWGEMLVVGALKSKGLFASLSFATHPIFFKYKLLPYFVQFVGYFNPKISIIS
jgi:hypothetical protein